MVTESDSSVSNTMVEHGKIVFDFKPRHLKNILSYLANSAEVKNRREQGAKTKKRRGTDQSTPAKEPRLSETNKGKLKREWKCGICILTFRTWDDLNVHVKSAHEETHEKSKWQCGDCGRTYSTKGNLSRHVRAKHSVKPPQKMPVVRVKADAMEKNVNLAGTLKKRLIQYECMHCHMTEDTLDAAVHHAQVHLVQEALIKANGSQYKLTFDHHHKKGGVKNGSLIKIIFDYKTLLKDAWFDMLQDIPISSKIVASCLYKHTRSVKLNWNSECRDEEEGRCVLYQCGACKLIVEPAKVQNHCDNNRACVTLGSQGHKCSECQKSFYTPKALRLHKGEHEKPQPLMVKIVTFNNKDDVQFNKVLKQISLSPIENTHEDTEPEKILRYPETPEINVLEKNVELQLSQYCVQCKHSYLDFEAHNAYHENKRKKTMETILKEIQPSYSANKVYSRTTVKEAEPDENVSHNDNNRGDFLKNRSKDQAYNDNTVEASKDDDSDRMVIDSESAVMAWDSGSDSNNSNRQSPAQLNLSKIMQNSTNDNIHADNTNFNSNELQRNRENNDKVAKEKIIGSYQYNQSALRLGEIFGEGNNPGDTLEADNESRSAEDQRVPGDNAESVDSRDKPEENGDVDQCYRAVQEHIGTTVNIGAEKKSVGGKSGGPFESSDYISLNSNTAILRGSIHQGDLRFNSSRNKQCTGIAAVACAAFCVLDPNTWTKSVIDKILVIGDKYYNDCISARALPATGEVNPDYLAVIDLMPTIIFNTLSVAIAVEEKTNFNGHIDSDNSPKGFPNLKNALKVFFRQHASGILTSNAKSVAVYRTTVNVETYWLFDSHSRGPEGTPVWEGAACCMRFCHLDDLHSLLRRDLFLSPSKVSEGRELINNLNVFSLTSISVRPIEN